MTFFIFIMFFHGVFYFLLGFYQDFIGILFRLFN